MNNARDSSRVFRYLALAVVMRGICGMGDIDSSGVEAQPTASSGIPQLRKAHGVTQLVVDGRPFLIRGGELGHSSASNLEYLAPRWQPFGRSI